MDLAAAQAQRAAAGRLTWRGKRPASADVERVNHALADCFREAGRDRDPAGTIAVHGLDERVLAEGFNGQVPIWTDLICRLAGDTKKGHPCGRP